MDKLPDNIIEQLQSKDHIVRCDAVHALARFDKNTVWPILLRALSDKDSSVRTEAANILAVFNDARAVKPLVAALSKERESYFVRRKILDSLGKLGDNAAFDGLVWALKDEYLEVQEHAVRALGLLKDERVIPVLINTMRQANPDVGTEAAKILQQLGVDVVPMLLNFLKEQDKIVRQNTPYILADFRDERIIEPLIQAWGDKDEDVGFYISLALSNFGELILPRLFDLLGKANETVRGRIATTLGMIKNPIAVEPLIRLLGEEAVDTRLSAARALRNIPDERAVKPLIKALGDKDARVRYWSAFVLGEIGKKEALPALEGLVGKDFGKWRAKATVSEAAISAIAQIKKHNQEE